MTEVGSGKMVVMEVVDKPLTKAEFGELSARYGPYFKVTVDIEREVLVAGCSLHSDGEEILLKEGSGNNNIWGGGVLAETCEVDTEAMLNIRPKLGNVSVVITDPVRQSKFLAVVDKLLFSLWR